MNKYLKYKKKYLLLKNQIGGIDCNDDNAEWREISNNGQNNCGIYISDKYKSLIMKCSTIDEEKIEYVNEINNIYPFFPKISRVCNKIYNINKL